MAYGLKYELHCTSKSGIFYKLQLLFDGYLGAQIDRNMPGETPLLLRKDAAAVIRGTSLDFGIREQVDFEFDEFYTNNAKKIKALVYANNSLIWSGYNLPQQYQAPYVPSPSTIRFTATDGLGLLKTESFSLSGLQSELAIIIHALTPISLDLGFSIAINLFETSHTHDRSVLAQTYLDASIFDNMNCYEVLEKILTKYDAEITEAAGRWHITCSVDKKSTRILYTSAGVYETTEAAPAVLELGLPDNPAADVHPIGNLVRTLEPGAKKVTISHDFGRKASLLDNYDFEQYSGGQFTRWTQNGTFTLSQKVKDDKTYAFLSGYSNVTAHSIEQIIPVEAVADEDFVFEIDYAPIGSYRSNGSISPAYMDVRMIIAIGDGVDTWYLSKIPLPDMTTPLIWAWVKNVEYTIIETVKASVTTPVWNRLRIVTEDLPCSGNLIVWLGRYYFSATPRPGDHFTGICYSEPKVYFINGSELYPSSLKTLAIFDNSTEPGDLGSVEIFAADAPDLANKSQLYLKITRLSDGTPTELWHRLNSSSFYTLIVQLARVYASNNRIAREKLTGTIKGIGISLNSIIKHTYNNNREFEIAECSWDLYNETYQVTLLELLAWSSEAITFTSESKTGGSNTSISSDGAIVGVGSGTTIPSGGGTEPVAVYNDTMEPTGFVNNTSSIIGFTAATREFIITPVLAEYKIYSAGTIFVKTDDITKEISTTVGLHYIYFDTAGVIQEGTDPWDIASGNIPIATVYWNGSDGILSDERHGIQMDGRTHEYLHETRGASYALGLTGTFAANGSTISIGAGEWYDEDLEWSNASPYTQCKVFWRIGTAWNWTAAQNAFFHAVGSVPQYNGSGALAGVGVSKYSISWIFITNQATTPVAVIMGQAEYNTQAQAEAVTPASLTLGSLPAAEMLLLYKVVWQRDGAVISVKSTADYRRLSGGPVSNYVATDHSALSKLDYASAGHTGFEADLGVPLVSGYVLSSTTAGVRSWIAASGGGIDAAGTPADNQVAVFTDADTLEGDAGLTYDKATGILGVSTLDAGDGVNKHLTLYSGDAIGAAGTDAGNIVLKAGNAINADSGSNPGNVFLVPGTNDAGNAVGQIYLGDSTSPGSYRGIQSLGSSSNVGMSFSAKGNGSIAIGYYSTGVVNVHGTQFYLESSTKEVLTRSNINITHMVVDGGSSSTTGGYVAGHVMIRGGQAAEADGYRNGGNVYIMRGASTGAGADGNVFIGSGSLGHLPVRTSEQYVVFYDPATGKLSYGPQDGTTTPEPTTTAAPTTTA